MGSFKQSAKFIQEKKCSQSLLWLFNFLDQDKPQKELKFVLCKLINFYVKGGSKSYIAVTKFRASWVDDKNFNIVFEKAKLKLAINFLLLEIQH